MVIEFALEGPPVSLNAKEGSPRSRRRYREWMERVRTVARSMLPLEFRATEAEVKVTIVCFHTEIPPDVDNIIKPIFDGMKGEIFADDNQVQLVISERRSLTEPQSVSTPFLATALSSFTEVVYVLVEWEE